MTNVFHYTDRPGWNGIRSQPDWRFKANQPPSSERPCGAYFTDLEPSPSNLRVLCKKLRIPNEKKEFVFHFVGTDGLERLNEGRGRDRNILFSRDDYIVGRERQRFEGQTSELEGQFP